jgi:hypothetical protein
MMRLQRNWGRTEGDNTTGNCEGKRKVKNDCDKNKLVYRLNRNREQKVNIRTTGVAYTLPIRVGVTWLKNVSRTKVFFLGVEVT